MEIESTEVVRVNVKTLKLHLKVCDIFTGTIESATGTELKEFDGYVPDFMPGEHYGDYVILDIDIDTGQITNWKQPTAEELQNWFDLLRS